MLTSVNPSLYLSIAFIALGILVYTLYSKYKVQAHLGQHYAMMTLKLNNLPKASPTRQRLEAARAHFDEGWQVLHTAKKPYDCLKSFAQAVEVDELACSWKHNYVEKMEHMQMVGDYFELPTRNDLEKYYSMLTEAYLVVVLYTVLSSYDKHEQDMVEDYKVVKSRMDVCVLLQKTNPVIYKLRAEFCMRLGNMADLKKVQQDFTTAIRLCEADEDGRMLSCKGVDSKQQRLHILACCHHQMASLARKDRNLPKAKEHFEQAVKYADPHYVGLAHCYFCLCIITLMTTKKAEPEERPGITLQAITLFKDGVAAEKRTLRYLPTIRDIELPRKLAKELIKRYTKGLPVEGESF